MSSIFLEAFTHGSILDSTVFSDLLMSVKVYELLILFTRNIALSQKKCFLDFIDIKKNINGFYLNRL